MSQGIPERNAINFDDVALGRHRWQALGGSTASQTSPGDMAAVKAAKIFDETRGLTTSTGLRKFYRPLRLRPDDRCRNRLPVDGLWSCRALASHTKDLEERFTFALSAGMLQAANAQEQLKQHLAMWAFAVFRQNCQSSALLGRAGHFRPHLLG